MLKYIFKRISLMIFTVIIIFILLFFLMQFIPGFPKSIKESLDTASSKEQFDNIIKSYNEINDPNPIVSFGNYLSGIFNDGNWGTYFADTTKEIPNLFFGSFKTTIIITVPAFLIGTLFGIAMGFIAGYKKGKVTDMSITIFATFFIAVPSFVLASFMILFGDKVSLPIDYTYAAENGKFWTAIILPMIIIILTSFSSLTMFVRNEVIDVLSKKYIEVAKSKGLSRKTIFFKYVLKNSAAPIIAIIVPGFITILTGTLIIEMFFNVHGASTIITNAIKEKEIYLFIFATFFYTFLGLTLTLVVDLLLLVIDPRIKYKDYRKQYKLRNILISNRRISKARKAGEKNG